MMPDKRIAMIGVRKNGVTKIRTETWTAYKIRKDLIPEFVINELAETFRTENIAELAIPWKQRQS